MPIALCRVDDRLIHGQVVLGWGIPLAVGLIVLVDDAVGESDWEQEMYRMAVPAEVEVAFATRANALAHLRAWAADPRPVFLLTGDIATMAELVTGSEGLLRQVNLGGVHAGPGRRERLRFLYLSDDELNTLRQLEAGGARVEAQDLPTSAPVPLGALH